MKTFLLLLTCLLGLLTAVAQEGQLRLDSLYSTMLNRTVRFYVYLPPGYDATPDHFPSVYLLRGSEWEWITQTQDGSRAGRDLRSVVNTLHANGVVGKMIYVMPGLSAPATDGELNAVALEMFTYVDSVYRTISTRRHRGVDGFSYGGLDVMNIVSLQPLAFRTAGSYDGSYWAFDMTRITAAPPDQIQKFAAIRFMHHSAGADFASTTNYESVAQLISVMTSRGLTNEFSVVPLSPSAIHNWWYADEHMIITLPLHWQTLGDTTDNIRIQLLTPAPGDRIAGTVNVQWSMPGVPSTSLLRLDYSRDKGKSWNRLLDGTASVPSFSWNTTSVPDGTWYLLRLSVTGDSAYGYTQLSSPFSIDNPGNGGPAVEILSPAPGATVTGLTNLQWSGSDPEGDQLTYSIDLSTNGGLSWENIASGLSGMEQYMWDSRLSPNSNSASIRIRCTDGQALTEATISDLRISNARPAVEASAILHIAGIGDGTVVPHVVNASQVRPHLYRVTFRDSVQTATRFDVRDLTSDSLLLSNVPIGGAGNESPEFEGLRLEVTQFQQPVYSPDSSRWLKGSSTLKPRVTLPVVTFGGGTIKGVAYPADYMISVYDHVVDTSSTYLDATATPMKFTVRNVTENQKAAVVFIDADGDSQISAHDEIVILAPGEGPVPVLTWDLFFPSVTNVVQPRAGDSYLLKILKPLTSRDTIQFVPILSDVAGGEGSQLPGQLILYQNYPNPFNPSTSINFDLPRAEHVRVTIFNILGQAVATVMDGPAPAGLHRLQWDASSLASGVYLVRVEAGRSIAVTKMLLLR